MTDSFDDSMVPVCVPPGQAPPPCAGDEARRVTAGNPGVTLALDVDAQQ
jgi:hypothetical protein